MKGRLEELSHSYKKNVKPAARDGMAVEALPSPFKVYSTVKLSVKYVHHAKFMRISNLSQGQDRHPRQTTPKQNFLNLLKTLPFSLNLCYTLKK